MKDLHAIFTEFKAEFPGIHEKEAALGREVHLAGGPLDERTRALIKVAVAGASRHDRALETHLAKAREVGASDEELRHALLLLIPTCGFPTFMEAYQVYKRAG
ncbi:MAG: carboxymuconolactone decarboxylase family protein [Deferrisomatales bacterium]|nr:carboxymuconolactone decarboxylase family protein [Deferrisomatales bacterium]